MARSDGYNTKTRQLILDYLINNRQHAVSASNILAHLEEQGAAPNPTTVYRYLDKLAGEQRVMKYVADKDCHFMDEVRGHLMAEHGFTLQCEGSVLYGLCRSCAAKEAETVHPAQTEKNCEYPIDTAEKP